MTPATLAVARGILSVSGVKRGNGPEGIAEQKDALGVDIGHRLEDIQRRKSVAAAPSEIRSGSFFIQICTHALWFVARRKGIDDQRCDALGEQMIDRNLCDAIGGIIEASASAHIDDARERPGDRRLEQCAGNRLDARIVHRDRDDVRVPPPIGGAV